MIVGHHWLAVALIRAEIFTVYTDSLSDKFLKHSICSSPDSAYTSNVLLFAYLVCECVYTVVCEQYFATENCSEDVAKCECVSVYVCVCV